MDIEPFPTKSYKLAFTREITIKELETIKQGRQPGSMDDRWIIYFESPWLYFHRSWTGIGIFKVGIEINNDTYFINGVFVNGDTDQYKSKVENELSLFESILNMFLDGRV